MYETCGDKGGCDSGLCVPGTVQSGWLGSVWTWTIILITLGVVFASVWLADVESEWYQNLEKPPGMISDWGFSVIWGILYVGLLVLMILSAWDLNNPRSGCMVLIYTLILALTLMWVIAFFQFHMLEIGIVILLLILPLTGWLIWLVTPPRNSSGGWFPHVFLWIFFGWIVIATYYNAAFAILNR